MKLAALARYGVASKAPMLRDLGDDRQAATLPATVRHLETASVDDALDVRRPEPPAHHGPGVSERWNLNSDELVGLPRGS
ncbi:hypothetical protein GCM10022226_80030 [Sphaerisporangium flaviroseum]|uniref:Uncharacterized protein n=1 Tax=Sphaerisporangium flaviroseum TaxID=509199 RepID=A0ABP7JH45_9ACTN